VTGPVAEGCGAWTWTTPPDSRTAMRGSAVSRWRSCLCRTFLANGALYRL